jgi:hypothetical protein
MRPRCLAREGVPVALIPEQIGKNSGAEEDRTLCCRAAASVTLTLQPFFTLLGPAIAGLFFHVRNGTSDTSPRAGGGNAKTPSDAGIVWWDYGTNRDSR